nr:site-specific integrase [Streptomyces uncialis]
MALAHQMGCHIRPGRGVVSAAVDKQHALTVTAEVHTGQDPVHDGEFDLCSGHHRTLSARRQPVQLLFSLRWDRLHAARLRHSALTHDAEGGTSTPMLPARSRHVSVRSLERYARPGVDAVARHVAGRDPAARRRT